MQVCKCKFFTLSFDYALLTRRIEDCFFSFQNTNNPKKTISNYFFQSYSNQTKLLIVTWKKKMRSLFKRKDTTTCSYKTFNPSCKRKTKLEERFFLFVCYNEQKNTRKNIQWTLESLWDWSRVLSTIKFMIFFLNFVRKSI